jgi:S1-C subfamily serine protease
VEKEEMRTIAVANLVDRTESSSAAGFSPGKFRSPVAKEMRRYGHRLVGLENALFDVDDSSKAELLIGGEVIHLGCDITNDHRVQLCNIGVLWSLLDAISNITVYKVLSRSFRMINAHAKLTSVDVEELFSGAARSLMARSKFVEAARRQSPPEPAVSPVMPISKFKDCRKPGTKFPKGFKLVMRNVVLLQNQGKTGAGVVISQDGLVFTTAHVLEGGTTINYQLANGTRGKATSLRFDKAWDVALVRLDKSVDGCLPVSLRLPFTGAEFYSPESPMGDSMTRGIVSGLRTMDDGVQVFQTDTSLYPENRGVPFLSTEGEVVGIVATPGGKGFAFAVPTALGLARLGVAPGETTDIEPQQEQAHKTIAIAPATIIDIPDANPHRICNSNGLCVRRLNTGLTGR